MGIKGPDGEADATQHRDEAALEDHGSRTQHGRLFPTPLTSLIHASSNAWRPAPSSCICLRWQSECIRVRVSGAVRRIDRTHGADPHFAHERGAKLWAWASRRSRHSCTPWPAKPVIVLWDLCAYRSAPVCTSVCVCVCVWYGLRPGRSWTCAAAPSRRPRRRARQPSPLVHTDRFGFYVCERSESAVGITCVVQAVVCAHRARQDHNEAGWLFLK